MSEAQGQEAQSKKLSAEDLAEFQGAALALAEAQTAYSEAHGRLGAAQAKVNEVRLKLRVRYGLSPLELPDLVTGEPGPLTPGRPGIPPHLAARLAGQAQAQSQAQSQPEAQDQ